MTIMIIGFMGMAFCAGCLAGFFWKGLIDRRYERKVRASLIRIGQMADDEIEAKDEKIRQLEYKILIGGEEIDL